jgi:hypothetical protein
MGKSVDANNFCDTALNANGVSLSSKKCTGVDGKTKAKDPCSCGENNVQVAKDEYCFVDPIKDGAKSNVEKLACPSTDGSTAATAACYCGWATCAKDKFCAPGSVVLTTARCTGEDGKTKATATCSCGSNNVQVAKDEYCFLDVQKLGKKSTKAKTACTGNKADGTTAAGNSTSDGCWCGVRAKDTKPTEFCCGGYVAPPASDSGGLSGGAIAGIVIGGIVVAGGIGAGAYFAMSQPSGGSVEKQARDRVDTALSSGSTHIPVGNTADMP